jgi:hypothetical protein
MIKRITSVVFGITFLLYLAAGVLNLFFGPRLSATESFCLMSKGEPVNEFIPAKVLLWPFVNDALYRQPSCMDPSQRAQLE